VIELVGSIGWGLLAMGAVTHLWHHDRLRELLAMHLDHPRVPAALLTLVEVALVVGIALQLFVNGSLLMPLAGAAVVVGVFFVGWISRLLVSGSTLPCACSFSQAPTSVWSLARACCVLLVVAFMLSDSATLAERSSAETLAIFASGTALSAALFVLPEAVSWPDASKALMARVDAHTPSP